MTAGRFAWVGLLTLPACLGTSALPARPVPAIDGQVYSRFRLQERPEASVTTGPGLIALDPVAPATLYESLLDESDTPDELAAPAAPAAPGEGAAVEPLRLEDVIFSVEENFPLILAALDQIDIVAGQIEQAQGSFDTKLTSKNDFEIAGFYETEEYGFGFEQATPWLGAVFSGGYRRGKGNFAIYDGKSKTNDGGEFALGVVLPLLRGREVDANRIELWRARLERQRVEPQILAKRLDTTQKAAAAYWKWIAKGENLRIARSLLRLAESRESQLRAAVEEGLLAEINLTDNRRLIVERQAGLVSAERDLQEAAIFLSLFRRDPAGEPVIEPASRLPRDFPIPRRPGDVLLDEGIELAIAQRPEVRAMEVEISQLELDLDLARNNALASLDVGLFASQDIGGASNDPDDKSDFEFDAQILFELPLQRRKARGKELELEGKISKRNRELRLAKDTIIAEVQDVVSELTLSFERVGQAEENLRLARELVDAERLMLQLGESDLFRVNVREQQSALAAKGRVEVLARYFLALTAYRATLGVPYNEVVRGQQVGGGAPR